MNKENRTIGLFGAIAIGIGGMVGGGIFAVLGEAVSLAHGATAIAFFFRRDCRVVDFLFLCQAVSCIPKSWWKLLSLLTMSLGIIFYQAR